MANPSLTVISRTTASMRRSTAHRMDADPWSPAVWKPATRHWVISDPKKSSPNLPSRRSGYRRKKTLSEILYLNQRVDAEAAWVASADYDACVVEEIPDLTGRPCYGGLDLSSSQDLTALVLCFPPVTEDEPYYILPFAWVPGEAVKRRSQVDRVPYDLWKKDGHIEALAGSVVDYKPILAKISEPGRTV
jgi:phage terminase large subunit-like protein